MLFILNTGFSELTGITMLGSSIFMASDAKLSEYYFALGSRLNVILGISLFLFGIFPILFVANGLLTLANCGLAAGVNLAWMLTIGARACEKREVYLAMTLLESILYCLGFNILGLEYNESFLILR